MSPRHSLPATRPDSDDPRVSVVVPTYEDAEFVGRALESIAEQTYDAIEVVLVDSSGVEWLESLAAETDWVHYSFQEPSGLPAARNHGIELASGEFVGFLDADDEWLPGKLAAQMTAFETGADVVYSDAIVVEDGEERSFTALPVDDPATHAVTFLYEGGVPIPTVVARRSCLTAEPFDESLPAVEDRHLLARLFFEYEPARVAQPLVRYNRRADSMSSDAEVMYDAELAVLESLFERYPQLDDHRAALRRQARYKYGKRLLRYGDRQDARRELWSVIREGSRDLRVFVLFFVSLLPVDGKRSLWHLERIQQRLRS